MQLSDEEEKRIYKDTVKKQMKQKQQQQSQTTAETSV
jgi:hypothetical protein